MLAWNKRRFGMKLWTTCMFPALKMNVNCWKNSGNTSITCNWSFDL